ncbi:MAG: 3-phosphoserine/phosphohydroxythreonine transaminase [Desulfobacterales bacterium]|nr:3-phosphoserine/phosphohydroxythreonine transaminase [Desulfobacterales bacterium]MBF0395511.1 3-phosphoserine/phosphohydroxythreonine transaminase [Desulfobacterales bacterium]
MKQNRVYNFNAGPATLPLPVLEEVQNNFLNFNGSGMSITEISHRSKWFEDVLNDGINRIKKLLKLDDKYHVLFIQGGASLQFSMVPMNLINGNAPADYINTGTWAKKAMKEAKILGKPFKVIATSEDKNFSYIPKNFKINSDAVYVHITSNNTIEGTQWDSFPDTYNIPLVADMSSDILCKPFDVKNFGLIFAGAQKNIGPAGVCMVIIREDMLEKIPDNLPTMLNYKTYTSSNSLYNTPPCFGIYIIQLVAKWIEETIGGLVKMEELNRKKAEMLYKCIDGTGFYKGTAEKDSRSIMNVTFRLNSEQLEKKFIEEAKKNGLEGLKGHRSVGGCRASIYNAMTLDGICSLVDFMKNFEKNNG